VASSAPVTAAPAAAVRPQAARFEWQKADRNDRAIVIAIFVYLIVTGGLMLASEGFLSPDQFFLLALAGICFTGRIEAFFWDWMPPILLLLVYDSLRGLTPFLIRNVHVMPMIGFDRWLFGRLPTLWLQERFYSSGVTHWYDTAAVTMYAAHFFVPLILAFVFWLIDRPLFKRYMAAMVIVSCMAFITYCVFPAMPPWMASERGFLPPVHHITTILLSSTGPHVMLPTVYRYVGINLVAAVPSLHAVFPLTMALFLRKRFPRWGWAAFLYPPVVWVGIVYLGDHYVFDIVAGIVYTIAAYAVTAQWERERVRLIFGEWAR
jgi:PAP2 superfamily